MRPRVCEVSDSWAWQRKDSTRTMLVRVGLLLEICVVST